MAAKQPKKLAQWHHELLNYLVAHPRASLTEVAAHFNVSMSWVSMVKNSDLFQEKLAEMRGEIQSEVVATVRQRAEAFVEAGLDALTNKVQHAPNQITVKDLAGAVTVGAEILGLTNRGSPAPSQTVNLHLVEPETLAHARELHAQRLEQRRQLELVTESAEYDPRTKIASAE